MDVLVLGAGVSGHTAATLLRWKSGKKHNVALLEELLSTQTVKAVKRSCEKAGVNKHNLGNTN